MKLYIKYSILFFGLIIIIDVISGVILKKEFDHIKFGDYSDINKSLKADAEILILGSSRALHHYNPSIISKAMKKSCYNAGFGGHGLFLNYALLKESIKKHSTKIIILDLSPNIVVDKESYSKLNLLLPYYNKYTSFKEIIRLNPEFSKLELVSNLYVYNSTVYDILRSRFTHVKKEEFGFIPLVGELDLKKIEPFFLENEVMDNNQIIYLNKIIDLCKNNNIKLITFVSPTYTKYDVENRIIHKFDSISKSKNIAFFDYSNYSQLYLKPRYFKDQIHLNKVGSEIFSQEISDKIKDLNY